MFVRVRINAGLIGTVEVVREHDDNGTDVGAVNTYRWSYVGEGGRKLDGTIQHRYGDGAIVLAHNALAAVASRYQVVAHMSHDAIVVSGCPLCVSLEVAGS